MTKEGFAARLRELREEKGLTQADLGERAGLAHDTVAQYERARREPGWFSVVALADALGLSTEAFREPARRPAEKRKAGRPAKKGTAVEPPSEG